MYTLQELLDLVREPNWADADSKNHRVLVVDFAGSQSANALDRERINTWLGRQTVPIVGYGNAGPVISDRMDLLVTSRDELDPVVEAINTNPQASAVLVQVLRSVPLLPVPQALALESLAYGTLQGGTEFARWLSAYQAGRKARPDSQRGDAPQTDQTVLMERSGAELAIVLNSPQNRNALSTNLRDELARAFKLVAVDLSITRVDVRANGPCFSAGGDLTEFGSQRDIARAHQIRTHRMPAQYLAAHSERYTFHLHGACIGAGIEMPSFAGRIEAASDTVLRLPEIAMGLIPGAGGCVGITRRIGRQRTAWMAITGEPVSADRALAWGLIDAVVD